MRLPLMLSTKHEPTILYSNYRHSKLIANSFVRVYVHLQNGSTQLTLHMCVLNSLFRLSARVLCPMALDESFRHAPADIDRGRDPHCFLQSLSGIWLCYRLDSSHELDFSCSHPNALVSFFYEAASQRKVAVPSFCLPSCHFIELLRMLAF